MKKLLLTVAALSVSVSMFAQGTVGFGNSGAPGTTNPILIDTTGDGVGDRNLALADGVSVSLWWAPAGTTDPAAASWQQLGARVNIISATPGFFFGGTRTVPSDAGGTYAFQVRAWDASINDWRSAQTTVGAKISVISPIFESSTGGGGSPPAPAVNLATIIPSVTVGTVVPEPSVLALGVLGVGALLLLRRRK